MKRTGLLLRGGAVPQAGDERGERLMQLSRFTAALLLSAAALLPLPASAQSQPASNRVLRVAPHADLKTLDPVAASIVITRMHGADDL